MAEAPRPRSRSRWLIVAVVALVVGVRAISAGSDAAAVPSVVVAVCAAILTYAVYRIIRP